MLEVYQPQGLAKHHCNWKLQEGSRATAMQPRLECSRSSIRKLRSMEANYQSEVEKSCEP
jgi:hypothetical protein